MSDIEEAPGAAPHGGTPGCPGEPGQPGSQLVVATELHIVTKGWGVRDANGGWPHARSPEQLRQAVHDNLIHLGLQALDVVNLRVGGFDSPTPGSIAEPFTALAEMQQEGLIKHLGISTVSAEQIAEAQSIAPIVCVQNFYNLAHRVDDDLVESLAAQGIAYVPYFPLGGFTPLQSDTLASVATGLDTTPMAVALAWLLQQLPEHPADPRHLIGRAPARERERRWARPFPGRAHRAEQHQLNARHVGDAGCKRPCVRAAHGYAHESPASAPQRNASRTSSPSRSG
jgi:hypothetical protein